MVNKWLFRALEKSRARGYLGPADIEQQIAHAEGFAQCWEGLYPSPPVEFLDLGSGGGLPGLVLLARWGCRAVLVDSMIKRMRFLTEVLAEADAPTNAEVIIGRAEQVAREPVLSGVFDLVTARSFGPPAVTAECGVRFLKLGGVLIVSEPPDDNETGRWNEGILAELGLEVKGRVRHGAAFQILLKTSPTPERYPRGIGIPGKSPLF
ncbi:MAG: RsmG family class I SAM-dependent methyltransferase [Acidimicrobiales bacterium]|jgi:16S rRNA (guanine527-N7)-methyltransferase